MSDVRFRKYRKFIIFFAYFAVAIITTWPLITQLATHLPSNSDDTLVHYWNGWWVQQALLNGRFPYETPYLFYPGGISLVTHNIAWLHIIPWLLLEPLLGGVLAYNLVLLLNLTLCGCTAFWLARELTGNGRAAFVAGLIYQAWPFRLSQLDHPNLIATYWIPIFFLFLIRTMRKKRWRDALLAGVAFALVGYTRWQILIPATLMGLIYFVASFRQWLPDGRRHVLLRLIGAGGVAVLLLLPPALMLVAQQGEAGESADLLRDSEESIMQTDLLAYITPAAQHPLLGELTESRYVHYYQDRAEHRRFPVYLGLIPLLLVGAGIWFRKRKALPWVLMMAALILLALGPLLRINGHLYPEVPTLYGALSPLSLFRLMRVPDRFNMFVALPASVLAAYGAAGLLARVRWQRTTPALFLAAGLILFEYIAVPVPLSNFSSSPFYDQLAQEPGEFAVLNLPIEPLKAKLYMYAQVTHQRPILQGKIARLPDSVYAYLDNNAWLRVLRQAQEMSSELSDVSRQLSTLAEEGVGYIIMHKMLVGSDRIAHWQRYLATEPRYEDERIIAYSTRPQAGQDFSLLEEPVPGLGPIKMMASTACLTPGGVVEVDVVWGSTRPPARNYEVFLTLLDETGAVQQMQKYPLSPDWPTGQWPANAVAWGYYLLRLSPATPVGAYTLALTLLDAESGRRQGTPLHIGSLTVQDKMCDFATEPQARNANALFSDEMRLLEYEIKQNGQDLLFTLYWRAERRMDKDYKIFVHVFTPTTGIPVAQDDSMPRRGAYATTFWKPGEVIDDRVSVSLKGAAPGVYGIAVGIYDPATGERLPVMDSQGELLPDGRFILPETVQVGQKFE